MNSKNTYHTTQNVLSQRQSHFYFPIQHQPINTHVNPFFNSHKAGKV